MRLLSQLVPPLSLLLCVACSKKADAPTDAQPAPSAEAPAPPKSAPPAEAPPAEGSDDRPPHPAIPDPMEEAQPSTETLASTTYRWLPGHWLWSGSQYEWQEGLWVYDVPGYRLVPPRWEWDGKQWVFHDAGWATAGSLEVVYRPTAVPADGSWEQVPSVDEDDSGTDVYAEADDPTYYYWVGRYLPPPIVYPVWHPHHHYYHHGGHERYAREPLHQDRRYEHAVRNDYRNDPPAEKHRDRVWNEPGTPRKTEGRVHLGIDGDPGHIQAGQPGGDAPAPAHRDQPSPGPSYADQPSHSYADQPRGAYADQPVRREPNRPPPAPAPSRGPNEGPRGPEPGPAGPSPHPAPVRASPHGGPHR